MSSGPCTPYPPPGASTATGPGGQSATQLMLQDWQQSYPDAMTEPRPRSLAIYRRGPAWIDGRKLRDQATLLDHGRFLASLERSGQVIHAGPAHYLDEVPAADPIGMVSFPYPVTGVPALLRDDPGLTSGLLRCDVIA